MFFPQCVSSCEDQDCVLLRRLYHIDCIDMGSPQCVSESVFRDCSFVRRLWHTECIGMVYPRCESWCMISKLHFCMKALVNWRHTYGLMTLTPLFILIYNTYSWHWIHINLLSHTYSRHTYRSSVTNTALRRFLFLVGQQKGDLGAHMVQHTQGNLWFCFSIVVLRCM